MNICNLLCRKIWKTANVYGKRQKISLKSLKKFKNLDAWLKNGYEIKTTDKKT